MAKRLLRMTIPSEFPAGQKAQKDILAAAIENGFKDNSMFALRLGLEEALHNAIEHGNRLDPHKKVRIRASVSPTLIEIVIEDEGPGFDPACVPDPRMEENLEKCGGRGILLIQAYMDEAEWTNGGRKLRMKKKNEENGPRID